MVEQLLGDLPVMHYSKSVRSYRLMQILNHRIQSNRSLFFRRESHIMLVAMILRHLLVLTTAITLAGCNRGMSACERATRTTLPAQSKYQQIAAKEQPGETPAMTYWVIDYFVTAPSGARRREQVHCSYMRDTGEAEPHRIASTPAPL